MAFMLAYCEGGIVPAIEYLPCSAITPKVGMALTQTSGKLAIATGTTAPKYISMIEKESACEAGDIIPVLRVLPGLVFDTTFSAADEPEPGRQGDAPRIQRHAGNGDDHKRCGGGRRDGRDSFR